MNKPNPPDPKAQEIYDRLAPIVETLIHACTESGLALTGFVLGADPPMLMHIGNTKERGEKLVELHWQLLEMYILKSAEGNVIENRLDPPVKED